MYTVKLSDGKDRALKMGSVGLVKRIVRRMGLEANQFNQAPIEEILFELLEDKTGLASADDVADLIPFSEEKITEINRRALAALLDKSYEEIVAMETKTKARRESEGSDSENPTPHPVQ